MLYLVLKWAIVAPLVRVLFRPWMEGEQNIPAKGPVLIASNHLSIGETYLIPAMIRRSMSFPAKIELFQGKALHKRLLGWFLRNINVRPIDRSGGRVSASDMDAVSAILREGGVLGIFPEGTRSPDGRLYKGKTGVARLVLQTGAAIVPAAMINTKGVPLRGLRIPWMHRPGLRFGKPMYFTQYEGAGNDREVLRWITDEVMNAIMELSGQTYVDAYAGSVKAAAAEGRELTALVKSRPGEGNRVPPVPADDSQRPDADPPPRDVDPHQQGADRAR
ncbi:lysophospholipid acyltransferase family protein [Microlunatus speluncae]|uniref:lysophospholipid acyltransferase family protein n=1 Tax=Microlunatus speluncae TaxID=2594267 RepID=UPI00126649CE|nr:lysophospholipid acyltransferase family protein [Microlunatus speluncae]